MVFCFFIHLERGHHLALFLAVYEVVVVLHRYEGREAIVDRVVCFGGDERRTGEISFFFFSRGGGDGVVPTLHLVDWLRWKKESDQG